MNITETDLHELADVATALDWLNATEMARNVRLAIGEIDRLREGQAEALRAEIARLRNALKGITLQYMGAGGNLRPEEVQLAMEKIARDALAPAAPNAR